MLTHKGTKTIETPRLILRRFSADDAQAMFENWAGDEEVTRFLTWPTHPNADVSRMVLESWVESYEQNNFYQWAIVPRELGQPIGSIACVGVNERCQQAHMGYCIGRQWWDHGYTSEALAAVIDFLFREVGVQRVDAKHDSRNIVSGAVMRKCGMKHEGCLRRSDLSNSGFGDMEWYGIIREDWEAQNY